MKPQFELYNTETETVEAVQYMTASESAERNELLRLRSEPQRWVELNSIAFTE